MANRSLDRFLGGSPGAVVLKLVFLSFVVGVLLSALDLHPLDLLDGVISFIERLWNMGFEALGRLGGYFVLGAVVVLPVWLVLRLMSYGRGT
jgi:cobalamin biosynthesis protein CobD/CbiB